MKSNREVYLDLAKFFAMLLMVTGHSFFELAIPETYDFKIFPWDWWNFARGKTAPLFLFISGAVHVFANFKGGATRINNDTFRRRISMSLILLGIGYIMNSPVNGLSEIFSIQQTRLYSFYQVNILHIFGIGLLILAFIYKYAGTVNRVMYACLILGVLTLVLSPLAVGSTLSDLPLFISNYFNYRNGSIFALLPYISYLFLGTVFGIFIKKFKDAEKIDYLTMTKYKPHHLNFYMALGGVLCIIFGIIATKIFLINGIRFDMRSDIGVVIRNVGIIISFIFLMKMWKIHSPFFKKLITILSKRAIYIYVIHLFIIYGIGNIHGLKYYFGEKMNTSAAFLTTSGVVIASVLLTLLIDKSLEYKFFIKIYLAIFLLYSVIFLLQ